jgi:serine phosphatase RsbU (regulator of sigma subunit)
MVSSTDILNAKILVVDDNATNVSLLERMLHSAGYTSVTSTNDPHAVYELYRENRYGLILLDLQMPGMDGFEVMERLKEIEGDSYLPVLVTTAEPSHKLRALKAGAKDFVSKPFDLAELRARVHNILQVRLLHLESKRCNQMLEETVRELEASREVIRLKTIDEQKKSERELALAQETQESLLPRIVPQFENFHIHAFNNPTRYVGGDFYDFLQLDSGDWMGVLADVSGKGMSAALLSSMTLGALSAELRSRTNPSEALDRVNWLLCERSLSFQFVTLFLFVLRPDGEGQFISAGHNPAYLYRSAPRTIEQLESNNCAVGIFDAVSWQSGVLKLSLGDILVVYSDGLTDAEDPREEMFGEERLLEVIRRDAPAGSQAVQQGILKAVADFTQGMPQTDDITFVVVEKYR